MNEKKMCGDDRPRQPRFYRLTPITTWSKLMIVVRSLFLHRSVREKIKTWKNFCLLIELVPFSEIEIEQRTGATSFPTIKSLSAHIGSAVICRVTNTAQESFSQAGEVLDTRKSGISNKFILKKSIFVDFAPKMKKIDFLLHRSFWRE